MTTTPLRNPLLPELAWSVIDHVATGRWAMYTLKGEPRRYLIITEARTACCNPHRDQSFYVLDSHGAAISSSAKRRADWNIDQVVWLDRPEEAKKQWPILPLKVPRW